MSSTVQKKRTTVYISTDVLEFLKVRGARGSGSVSQQLEDLVRRLMPPDYSEAQIQALEKAHAEGYRRHPADGEFDDLHAEQQLDEL